MFRRIYSFTVFFSVLLTAVNFSFAQNQKPFDLVINNARIVDGSGNPWFRGDVAIKNGKIAKVGRINAKDATQTIDAQNKILAPGFIDVHAHVENIYDHPNAENFVRMGVTSLVTGNCGISETDISAFLGKIKQTPLAINIGTLIAHGSVRAKVIGLDNRQPTEAEQTKMNQVVEQAMKDGALGLSTGLIYLPGTFAKTEEVVALAQVAARFGGIYTSHIRDESTEVVKAIEEAINIGEQAKMPVEISHFKITSKRLWGESPQTIKLVTDARLRGLPVTVDQYAYAASSTSLDVRLPNWAVAGGRQEGIKRLENLEMRKKIIDEMKVELKKKGFDDYSFSYVADYRPNPEFNGKNIVEITQLTRGKSDLDQQIEQILEMYAKGGAGMVYQVMSEDDVRQIMRQPFTMIASDSIIRKFGEGSPHPREYGNNARVLGRYVRELKIITLEDAIRKMTSLPAQTFNLRNRGLIRENFAADLVIFDESKISDKATFEKPHQYAEGFQTVIVNGNIIFDGTQMTGLKPGQTLAGSNF